MLAAIVAAWVIGFALLAGRLAADRDRSVPLWIGFGAVIGPLALLLLRVAPLGRCPNCASSVRGWPDLCVWCGQDLRVAPGRSAPALAASSAATPITTATPTATPSSGPSRSTRPPKRPVPGAEVQWFASGVYLTGTVRLQVGARYTLELDGSRFLVRGPVDTDPNDVGLECEVDTLDASAFGDRLIINQPTLGSSSMVLGFIAIAGGTPDAIARQIVDRAERARQVAT